MTAGEKQNQICKYMLLDEKAAKTILLLESFFEDTNQPKDFKDSLANRTEITEGAAELLATFRGHVLDLSGLKELSQPAAAALGAYTGDLYLDGLKTVTANTLKHLLQRKHIVRLDGLETLPDITEDWEDLQENVSELYLNGVGRASYDSLKKVASVAQEFLHLNSLESLPQQEGLFETCPAILILGGLKKITKLDIQNFLQRTVELEGLEEIDVECARLLAEACQECTLSIGLRKMPDEVASEILRSQSEYFYMKRLEELTPHAAEACGKFIHAKYVHFDGLQQISDEAFELLLADYTGQTEKWCPGSIDLNGLTHLTPRMRKALEETKHDVSLLGITEQDPS